MGFLEEGDPLDWQDSKPHLQYVRRHGILQFIAGYNKVKDVENDDLFWGDEVEYAILDLSPPPPALFSPSSAAAAADGAAAAAAPAPLAEDRTVKLSLVGAEKGNGLMEELNVREAEKHNQSLNGCSWHQEYGSWMIEGTPSLPYGSFVRDLVEVECNMRLRRTRLLSALGPSQIAPSTTNFPLLGDVSSSTNPSFTNPPTAPGGAYSESSFVSDTCINPHPRFGTLTRNIRSRRGAKVNIRVPLFRDARTPEFSGMKSDGGAQAVDGAALLAGGGGGGGGGGGDGLSNGQETSSSADGEEPLPYHLQAWDHRAASGSSAASPWPMVKGDCMAFGMGCCCLQVTFQSRNVSESRFMYDQLAGLAPIMMALGAATPIFKGRLVDTDVRWTIISQSVDDRTPAERGLSGGSSDQQQTPAPDAAMAGGGVRRLYKSRYDSVSCFLSEDTPEIYNDIPCEVDEELLGMLRAESFKQDVQADPKTSSGGAGGSRAGGSTGAGMDEALCRHVAHLFTRDPLVMFHGMIEEVPDDGSRSDHWESLQSTNWQTMRWKPPPPRKASSPCAPHIGWRTEFRSMEVQLTDFENAVRLPTSTIFDDWTVELVSGPFIHSFIHSFLYSLHEFFCSFLLSLISFTRRTRCSWCS